MSNNNEQNENFSENFDATKEEIYNALIELGWLLPRTEEDLRRAEKALEKAADCPPFPPELEDPLPLIERLRQEQEASLNQESIKNEAQKSHLPLVAGTQTFSKAEENPVEISKTEGIKFEDDAPSFPALLRREIPDETPSVVAENLGVTRAFLKLVSDNRKSIPNSWRNELAREAKKVYSIDEARSRRTLTEHYSYQQIAASRAIPYSDRTMDWREILQKSGLSPEREQHYLLLAEEEEKQQ
jgi:hypothetical protein